MKLLYKGEQIATLNSEEANGIINAKGQTIIFKGQRLRASQVEVMNERNSVESEERKIIDYTTEELNNILGDFKREYKENSIGEVIHNKILGFVHKGNIEHALRIGAITEHKNVYYVKLPEYRTYDLRIRALNELYCRSDYARKMNKPNLESLENQMSF